MAILTSVFPSNERGKVLGISVATTYTGLSVGHTKLSEVSIVQLMNGMKMAFIVFTVLCFSVIVASLIRGKKILEDYG